MIDTFIIKDADGNRLNTFLGLIEENENWVGREFNGVMVASAEQLETVDDSIPVTVIPVETTRRVVRNEVFTNTLDKLNPIRYNLLTTTQRNNLATWRQAWLDYPETGTLPDDTLIQGVFD